MEGSTLTLFRPLEFPIKLDTVKSGWSIVYIGGYRLAFLKKSVKVDFVLSNSADTDKMLHLYGSSSGSSLCF